MGGEPMSFRNDPWYEKNLKGMRRVWPAVMISLWVYGGMFQGSVGWSLTLEPEADWRVHALLQLSGATKLPRQWEERFVKNAVQVPISEPDLLPVVIALVDHPLKEVRKLAVTILGRLIADPVAMAALTHAAGDPDAPVRAQVMEILVKAESLACLPTYITWVNDVDARRRSTGRKVLIRLGPDAAPAMRRALGSAPPDGRKILVECLVQCQGREDFAVVVEVLKKDPEAGVRAAAATALGASQRIEGLPALRKALTDSAPLVREAAKSAIKQIGDTGSPWGQTFRPREP